MNENEEFVPCQSNLRDYLGMAFSRYELKNLAGGLSVQVIHKARW